MIPLPSPEDLAVIDRLWPDTHSKSGGPPLDAEHARRRRSRALSGPYVSLPCPEDPDKVIRELPPILNTARAQGLPLAWVSSSAFTPGTAPERDCDPKHLCQASECSSCGRTLPQPRGLSLGPLTRYFPQKRSSQNGAVRGK
jgi:hypothetical protein